MKDIDTLIDEVSDYCKEHNIEYVLAVADYSDHYSRVSHNIVSSKILRKTLEILKQII
jgi:hypothetical protein